MPHIQTELQIKTINVVGLVFEEAVKIFGEREEWKGRLGAYLCLAEAATGNAHLVARVDNPADDKVEKYVSFSQEKPKRLAQNPNHLTSWQSRNPEANQWGGAIRATDTRLLSLSGAPELGDEAIMMVVAEMMFSTDFSMLAVMANMSGNEYWQPLRDAVTRDVR